MFLVFTCILYHYVEIGSAVVRFCGKFSGNSSNGVNHWALSHVTSGGTLRLC